MSEAEIEIHNPAYAGLPPEATLQRVSFPRLKRGARLRLGLLNNKKPNGTELLKLIEERLGRLFQLEARTYTKGDGAHGAPSEMIRELASFAEVAITATCD
ncbi:MAG TPA: hypothetical protein VFD49_24370 [Candidatus Dormibacteraeota bacterium]|nr:hypothetical protein [Candidatus Dormibacteraeota bacterium]